MVISIAPIKGLVFQVSTLFFGLIVSITVNGFFRALVASKLGDDTPEENGFLTLNPAVHVNFFTLLPMVLLTLALSTITKDLSSVFTTMIIVMIFSGLRWSNEVQTIFGFSGVLYKSHRTSANYELFVWLMNLAAAFLLLLIFRIFESYLFFSKSFLIALGALIFNSVQIIVLMSSFDMYPLPFCRGFSFYRYYLPVFTSFLDEVNPVFLFGFFLFTFFFGGFLVIPTIILSTFKFILLLF